MLAWTQQNTMQRAMWTVLECPQSHAISKTIKMLTNKSEVYDIDSPVREVWQLNFYYGH